MNTMESHFLSTPYKVASACPEYRRKSYSPKSTLGMKELWNYDKCSLRELNVLYLENISCDR